MTSELRSIPHHLRSTLRTSGVRDLVIPHMEPRAHHSLAAALGLLSQTRDG